MMIPGSQRMPLEGITMNRVNNNVIVFNSQSSANADCYVKYESNNEMEE